MKQIEQIREIHHASDCTYGSPRVHEQLLAQGQCISRNTVAKLMRESEIFVKPVRAFVPQTTVSDPTHQVFDNVLDREFKASRPNQKWVCDITYVATGEGWLYLAVVIDLCSRKIVGWSMRDDLKSELASAALAMALENRKTAKGLLHHSDRGVQYTSGDYQSLLCEVGIEVSMSGAWVNAGTTPSPRASSARSSRNASIAGNTPRGKTPASISFAGSNVGTIENGYTAVWDTKAPKRLRLP